MSQTLRQSELFTAQDWQVLYRAFTQINFNASDPTSINKALRDYITINYSEDFSDWIESSEFVAIIDLLSYLAGTLAFKTDINARENFLETAEARESILRLARFLSYNPRRNYPATGLLKIVSIKTDDDVYDAAGNNLQNREILWDNADDPDWLERFVLLLNSVFVPTNQFGIPLKTVTLGSVRTQLYRMNARFGDQALAFSGNVSGANMPFEIYNVDVNETTGLTEREPNMDSALHMLYRTDGNGASSPNSGFFVGFRQGNLQYSDLFIDRPTENQLIDLNFENINETDVWVQSLNDDRTVRSSWTKVPAIFSDNITFNSISPDVRDIFSVVTRDRDQVSIRFSDGRFGSAPVGRMRFWYRTSNGFQYQIRPIEMNNIKISVPYINRRGLTRTLSLTLSLQYNVSNSSSRETEDQVRQRAPQLYATQGRMVSGEDYNTFVLSSNQAVKIKALNRIYAGHSRFIDMNDPTGSYQDVSMFSDDGMFYKEKVKNYAEVALTENKTPIELQTLFVEPALRAAETRQALQDFLMRQARNGNVLFPLGLVWNRAQDIDLSSNGWFNKPSPYLRVGTTLMFQYNGITRWVTITDVKDDPTIPVIDGYPGNVVLNTSIPTGAKVVGLIPSYANTLSTDVTTSIQAKFLIGVGFSLWFDYNPSDGKTFWIVRPPENIDQTPQVIGSSVKVMTVEYLPDSIWRFTATGLRYSFESLKNVRFFYDGKKAIDYTTGQVHQDKIRILRQNPDLMTGLGLGREYELTIDKTITYSDGYADPRRIAVSFIDSDGDGYPDDPDTYYRIADHTALNVLLFWVRDDGGMFLPSFNMWVFEREEDRENSSAPVGQPAFQLSGESVESFWLRTETGWIRQYHNFRFARGRGPNVAAQWIGSGGVAAPLPLGTFVNFHWKHFAPAEHRVDPAKTNVIDMFVLTTEYDFLVRQWIGLGADLSQIPAAPTELELRTTFGQYEKFKMFSDELVWRPVKYKYLFGNGANDALQATFKVIKLPNASVSDGEIKALVIRAINNYFAPEFWDFGETFYFTELAAYVHQQLATIIASIVIVPETDDGSFGEGFEVRCRSDEVFISTAQVNDVTIITSNTPANLRIK